MGSIKLSPHHLYLPLLLTLFAGAAHAELPCSGARLAGTVEDSTAAIIPGATLTLDGARTTQSSSDGSFAFPCVAPGKHELTVAATSFAAAELPLKLPLHTALRIQLQPATVDASVTVSADETPAPTATSSGPTQTITGQRLQSLADDPDDLLRELQQLAAAGGGNPANTTISVDGFNDSTTLPPKSSIAYIQVNPDMFSAEYREPPFEGGRVNVYTKPGQAHYHGALFTTLSSSFENARDPFSVSSGSLGKQRFGFELSGPLRPDHPQGQDFSLSLEHRSIDDVAVVNATTLGSSGNAVSTVASVADPQRLWIGLARVDLQLSPRNTFTASFGSNVSHLVNVGVGGSTLAEGGYDSQTYDNTLRLSNVTVVNAHLMHEARLSLRSYRRTYLPNSTAPQLNVAGAFTAGGNTLGARHSFKLNSEFDDDAILTTKAHTIKFGTQMLLYSDHLNFPTLVNGSYTFGGGTAPVLDANNQPTGQTTTITGLEQYRRAQLGLAGGTPTAYSAVTGDPHIQFNLLQAAFFVQDEWTLPHGWKVASGLRYALQTHPTALAGLTPRLGVLWSPNKKGTWTLHAHVGTFTTEYNDGDLAEWMREDGTKRVTSTIYNPVYGSPFANATPITTYRTLNPHLTLGNYIIEDVGGTRSLPLGFNLSVDLDYARLWNQARSVNINSPLNGAPTGARALGIANTNILQDQNSGQGYASVEFFGLENHALKRVQFFVGAVHVQLIDDTNDDDLDSPQSAFTDAGELAPRSGQTEWNVFGNASASLPQQLRLSLNLNGGGDGHYDITTGQDNNGDGNFNDRPQYALPGTPLCSATATTGTCGYATPYGLLVASGGTGTLRRNSGVMPWTLHLDANLQRAFALNNPKADHPQSLTVNVRSSNVLNHLNVDGVDGVLGSPQFGQATSADNGRRVEAGLRYSF